MSSVDQAKRSRSLDSQEILEEDEYTAALSQIIARDFFPSLNHLDATNSYLDALQSQDPQQITASVRRLHDLATPLPASSSLHAASTLERTPFGLSGETPVRTANSTGFRSNKFSGFNTDLSLDEFQAKYTSEDNASFVEVLNEENKQRREKWKWAWEAQKRALDIKAIEDTRRNSLFIEDSTSRPPGVRERLVIEKPDVKLIIGSETQTSDSVKQIISTKLRGDLITVRDETVQTVDDERVADESRVALHAPSDLKEPVDVMAPLKDTRAAGVDGWAFKARNALMFPPDADRSPYDGPTSLPRKSHVQVPKIIEHANTRLPEQSNEDRNGVLIEPASPVPSRIGAAIAGEPYAKTTTSFPLLPSVPSPTPSQLGPAAVNKLMTWGTISGTPRVLSTESEDVAVPGTPFHLPPPTPREKVAHKLASSASRSLRAKASLLSGTPTPFRRRESSTRSDVMSLHSNLLTPAARRLLDRTVTLGTSASRRADAMQRGTGWEGVGKEKDMAKVRWTPSPMTRRAL